ncbi:alpha/beta fold hydrolase [Amycolatopsis thermoflava]|uniref:alpha/beta fold hydrolase n=1 Tax=Amycolatopsis thermoflava TaxID=84480 RepID=UPI003828B6E5
MILHGWDELIRHLARHFRVVRNDRRGHGASDRPAGQGRIGEDMTDLAGLVDRLRPARIVGTLRCDGRPAAGAAAPRAVPQPWRFTNRRRSGCSNS